MAICCTDRCWSTKESWATADLISSQSLSNTLRRNIIAEACALAAAMFFSALLCVVLPFTVVLFTVVLFTVDLDSCIRFHLISHIEEVVELALAGAQKTIERREREATGTSMNEKKAKEYEDVLHSFYNAVTDTLENIRTVQRTLAQERLRLNPSADNTVLSDAEIAMEEERKEVQSRLMHRRERR